MMYIKALLYAPLSFVMKLFVWLTAPLWALWPAFTANPRPWFTWLYTHDDWIYGFGWPKDYPAPGLWQRYKLACWWMWRNPGYGFNAYVLGLDGPLAVTFSADRRTWKLWRGDRLVGFGVERDIGPFGVQIGWDDRELVPGNHKYDFSVSMKD